MPKVLTIHIREKRANDKQTSHWSGMGASKSRFSSGDDGNLSAPHGSLASLFWNGVSEGSGKLKGFRPAESKMLSNVKQFGCYWVF